MINVKQNIERILDNITQSKKEVEEWLDRVNNMIDIFMYDTAYTMPELLELISPMVDDVYAEIGSDIDNEEYIDLRSIISKDELIRMHEKEWNDEDAIEEEEEINRKKYRYKKQDARFKNQGIEYGRAITLYIELMPKTVAEKLRYWCTLKGKISRNNLMQYYKQLTVVSKKNGEKFDKDWKYFVNLELLGGYQKGKKIEEFEEDVRIWVQEKHVHKIITEEIYNMFFQETLEQVVEVNEIREFKSIDEFIQRARWAVNGASNVVAGYYEYDGKKKKMVKNKRLNMLFTKDEILKDYIVNNHKARSKALMKLEPGKVRAIVNADFTIYMKMSYLNEIIEKSLRETEMGRNTTLFMSNMQYIKRQLENINDIRRGDKWFMPLDQAEFDHQPTFEMIKMTILEITRKIKNFEVQEIVKKLIEDMSNDTIDVGKKEVKYEKGILSGWKWTALLDTVINTVELKMAEKFSGSKISRYITQGDDDDVVIEKENDCIKIAMFYKLTNLQLNAKKFWIEKKRDEYLRKILNDSGVTGYPARVLPSILYVRPMNGGNLRNHEYKPNEIMGNWSKMYGRGGEKKSCYHHCYKDVSGLLNISIRKAKSIVHTPKSFGGGGYFPYDLKWQGMSEKSRTEDKKKFSVKSENKFSDYINKETLDRVTKRMILGEKIYEGKIETEVTEVQKPKILRVLPSSGKGISIKPKYEEEIRGKYVPNVIREAIVDEFSKMRTVKEDMLIILKEILTKESYQEYLSLIKKSKTIANEWLQGLMVPTVNIFGVSEELMSTITKQLRQRVTLMFLNSSNMNRERWKTVCYSYDNDQIAIYIDWIATHAISNWSG